MVASSQTTVEGQVVDSAQTFLPAATVVLLQAQDSVMHSYTISDANGGFIFSKVPAGEYLLQITYVGYHNHSQEITVAGEPIQLGKIALIDQSQMLDEVAISAEHIPIMIKQDTIEYNAAAFKTQPNDVVEDLLKKLPGVEVESDGTIKAQGEEVEKVLVDGKEFFGNDTKIATQNLPADAVDKVQVFDKLSEMSEFTGIDDGSRDKTINLALKEDKKQGYFGNLSGHYGTDDRYQLKGNINRFSKKLQFSMLAGANNINEQNFSINDYISFMGGLQSLMSGGRGMIQFGSGGGTSGFLGGNNNTGITTSQAGGANLNYDISDKTEISASYFYNHIRNNIESETFRQNFLEGSTFDSEEINQQINENDNHRLNLKVRHDINENQDLQLRSSISFNDGSVRDRGQSMTFNNLGELENTADRNNLSNGDGLNLDANLLYRLKFTKKGRSLVTNFSVKNNNIVNNASITAANGFLLNQPGMSFTDLINQSQFQRTDGWEYGARVSFTEPLGGRTYLELKYAYRQNDDDLQKDFFDIISDQPVFNTTLSNLYNRDYNFNSGGANFRIVRKKWNWVTGAKVQNADLKGDLVTQNTVVSKNFLNLLPSTNFRYTFTTTKNFDFSYSTSVSEPSVQQLQPLVDNSNPISVYIGNPDLRAAYNHRFTLHYTAFDQFNFRSFFVSLNGTYTSNAITNSQTIDNLFRQTTQPVNVDYNFSLSNYLSFGTPLKFIGSKVRITSNTLFNQNIVFINGTQNDVDRWSQSVDIRIENRKKNVLDVMVGTKITYNQTQYSVNKNLDQSFINRSYYADIAIDFAKTWTFKAEFDYRLFNSDAFADNQEFPLLRAYISKTMLESKRLELKLSAFDILNQNEGVNRSSELNYIQDQRFNALSRYFMFGLSYAIRGVGAPRPGIQIIQERR